MKKEKNQRELKTVNPEKRKKNSGRRAGLDNVEYRRAYACRRSIPVQGSQQFRDGRRQRHCDNYRTLHRGNRSVFNAVRPELYF